MSKVPVFFDIAPTKMAKEVLDDKQFKEQTKHFAVPTPSRGLVNDDVQIESNPLLAEGEGVDTQCTKRYCPCGNPMLLIPIFLGVLIAVTITYKLCR